MRCTRQRNAPRWPLSEALVELASDLPQPVRAPPHIEIDGSRLQEGNEVGDGPACQGTHGRQKLTWKALNIGYRKPSLRAQIALSGRVT